MKVLVVGGGGREHAIAAALARCGSEIYAAMKNKNPGIARLSRDFKLIKETDVDRVKRFALESHVDLAVIGPEAPLEVGLVDLLQEEIIGCVGPTKNAAMIETSKRFMRELMQRHHIPGNMEFATFDSFQDAHKYVKDSGRELAVKPVGLTGGKGVKIQGEHLMSKDDVIGYLREIFDKNIGGSGVVLEERAQGEEFTLQAFSDGKDLAPMPIVQDHKRAFEGDEGPNTGGMGSYSMSDHRLPFLTSSEYDRSLEIMRKVISAMASDGTPYSGILYGQFMLTKEGPKVIEFNARFGDPEAMNVLSIIDSSFIDVCQHVVNGSLAKMRVKFKNLATVCKYVVPKGYGIESKAGLPITVDERAVEREGAALYYAMVNEDQGRIMTTSSRALAVVGIDPSFEMAEKRCERALEHVSGKAIYVRHDIGKSEAIRRRMEHMARVRQ